MTVAFLGLTLATNQMMLSPPRGQPGPEAGPALSRGEPSAWMVVPVAAGLVACWCSACTRPVS